MIFPAIDARNLGEPSVGAGCEAKDPDFPARTIDLPLSAAPTTAVPCNRQANKGARLRGGGKIVS